MGRTKELWEAQLENESEDARLMANVAAEKTRAKEAEGCLRQEREWAARHPVEWAEWVRILPLMPWTFDFGTLKTFDFSQFLDGVGQRPSPNHAIARRDEALPYMATNLVWSTQAWKRDQSSPATPYLTVSQAAAYCSRAPKTILNHHSLGTLRSSTRTRPILFRREDLDAWLAGPVPRRK